MPDEIRPALTREEWAAWRASVSSQMPAADLFKVIARSNYLIPDEDGGKITRADVSIAEGSASHYELYHEVYCSVYRRPCFCKEMAGFNRQLAAKLAALLPPEDGG